jgi:allantoate deiminase
MGVLDVPRELRATAEAGARVLARCAELAGISDEPGRLTRSYASPAMARANALVAGWMREAGLAVRTDAAGNLIGSRPGPSGAGVLLLGSHLDTVRGAGAFDGPLGVLAALEALAGLRDVPLAFGIDLYAFADEEGLRYGTAYLGSRAVAGTFDSRALDLVDAAGIRLADALRAFGGDPAALASAARRGEDVLGYVEVHIEQGPVLEELDAPVGVVSAIAGATRAEVIFAGRAGHAGTVPMGLRHDALAAGAEWVLAVEATGRSRPGLVATVGRLDADPGAINVVPGEARALLDVRHPADAVRAEAVAALRARAEAIAAGRDVRVDWRELLDTPAVVMDPGLTDRLGAAAGPGTPVLASGAGHDAVALAALCPVAMLFVRCRGGISHHPDESVREADAGRAVEVLGTFLRGLGMGRAPA